MFQPLSGLRVIDLTQVLAGPYSTYQLALMGAEVIKIELPGEGDATRSGMGAPALGGDKMGLPYVTQGSNKRSLTLNLKTQDGLALLKRLIATADIFVQNFKPGTARRLGVSFEDVKQMNPKIVHCSISAYGQDGPIGDRPAYDHVVQGMCGITMTTGTPDSVPNKVGAPYIDYATGLNAAFAIVSALHETRQTGEAVSLDVAMLDSSMLLMASMMTSYLSTGVAPTASGNEAQSRSPSSGAFETTKGVLMIAANNERQHHHLCAAIGRPELLTDPRWADLAERRNHTDALRDEIAATVKTKSADEWEIILNEAGVPAARVRDFAEVMGEGQLKARGITTEMTLPGRDTTVHVPTLGFKVNGAVVAPSSPPPELGGDTDAILGELGISGDEVARLRADGVV
ncbi:MAG: CoA transferase [Rhodospirillaceae bacterium]|jgi:crotonobetainyl-CoA:carnitine CoA-transferase CaiB-like acyl-CoA transferase|nr:CoA transferase [Rhodospirillaceae bacterium]MBT5664181.1 CoA transferase [Rhodospirillaceae bacterium]